MNNIHWTFVLVLGGTLATVNLLIAVADFLQGGVAWPCLGVVAGLQVVALGAALR